MIGPSPVIAGHQSAAQSICIAYGPDSITPYRLAATSVDRILKGENPSNLPVQAPTK